VILAKKQKEAKCMIAGYRLNV